jgi:shikimate dehydrogenase
MQRSYGLIGYPLSHSFSPGYFKTKFEREAIDSCYELFSLPSVARFPELLKQNPHLTGLNVTIPYKQAIIPYLDELDNTTQAVGAVNCITISQGKTKGYNTDVIGFKNSLVPLLQPWHKKALVLGTGGASLAVTFVLKEIGIDYLFVSRQSNKSSTSYQELSHGIVSEYKLIVNTTPLGMFPENDSCPDIPYGSIGKQHLLYDLVYNPAETLFLSKGKQRGAATKNGLEMLELQAEASWNIWNGQPK